MKYKENINVNNIIQGDDETNSIINKTGNYLIDLFFDIDQEKDGSDEEEEKIGNQDNLEYSEKINDGSSNNKDANEQDILKFEEFYPKIIIKSKKKKRNYIENFGQDNDLKKYLDELKLYSKSKLEFKSLDN